MNKFFKSVWNESVGAWVATSEKSPARGKRSGRAAKAVMASVVTFTSLSAFASGLDGGTTQANGSGVNNGVALGAGSVASADFGAALGPGATAAGVGDVAIGASANVDSGAQTGDGGVRGSVGIGANVKATGASATAIGGLASATGNQATAIGSNASAAASGALAAGYNANASTSNAIAIGTSSKAAFANSVAIGSNSSSDRVNSVSFGNSGFQRTLAQVARGTAQFDATNVAQLNDTTALFGAGAAVNADGTIKAPTYTANGTSSNTVAGAVTALDAGLNERVKYDTTAHDKVTLGNAGTPVALTNVKNGALTSASFDAVNGSQLYATNQTISANAAQVANVTKIFGAGAAVNPDGSITAPVYTVNGSTSNNVGGAIAALDKGLSDAVHYDSSAHTSVTLGVATTPVTVSNVNAGALSGTSTDAVNGAQLFATNSKVDLHGTQITDVTALFGSGAKINPDGSIQAPSYKANGLTVANVGAAVTALDSGLTERVKYDTTSHDKVTLGSTGTPVTLTNVKDATLSAGSLDAVNGSQLYATNKSLSINTAGIQDVTALFGAGAKVNADGTIQAPSYTANGSTVANVGAAVTALDSGLTERVKYDTTAHDKVTLGGATPVTLTNVKAATLSSGSLDAVNGSQLFATNQAGSVNAAGIQNVVNTLGGGAFLKADGSLIPPTYTADGKTLHDVGSAFDALNAGLGDSVRYDSPAHDSVTLGSVGSAVRLTNVKAAALDALSTDAVNGSQLFTTNQNISKLNTTVADAVLYDSTKHDKVTLGYAGAPVTLTAVAPGAIGVRSLDAVNGSQIYALSKSAADALGGGAAVNTDGTLKKPLYSLDNGTVAADNVGSAVSNLDGRVTKNTNGLASLNNDFNTWTSNIANGQVGIVQQNVTSRVITVGGGTNGGEVSVAGTTSLRVVSGVANGDISATSNQAVNGSQLFGASSSIASALGGGSVVNKDGTVSAPVYNVGGTQVNNVGAAIDNLDGRVTKNTSDIAGIKGDVANVSNVAANAVAYDSSAHDKVTLGGQTPTDGTAPAAVQLTNVKDGELSATSSDAVNGKQLNDTNTRLDTYEGIVKNFQGSGVDFLAVNSSTATAAVPVASGTDAVAIGANSKATGNNSVALGAGSVADQDNTVSVGAAGSERRVTNVAAGRVGTDAVNMSQLNSVRNELSSNIAGVQRAAFAGVAAAMAMPNLTPSGAGKTVVAAGVGNYKGYSAFGAGATYRSRDGAWLVNGALSVTGQGDAGVRAQVGYEF